MVFPIRNRSRASLWPAAFALLFSHALSAQETASADRAEALASQDIAGPFVAEALRRNPGLSAHRQRYEAARASIPAAAALPNPMVQLTHFVESIQTRTGPQRQALMLQQPIPWLGKLDRKRDAAQARSESLWHAFVGQQFAVVDQASEQVFELSFLDKAVAIADRNLGLLERLETIVENRVKSGGQLASLLRLQLERERLSDERQRLLARRQAASARLDATLGQEPRPEPRSLALVAPEPLRGDPEDWYTSLLENAPPLAVLRALGSSEEARAELARLAARPDFTVGINYIRTGEAMSANQPGSGTDPWALMVGASLPLWNKANNALERQAALEVEAISAQIEEKRLQLLAQAHALVATLRDAEQRLQRYDASLLPLARQTLEITQTSYESGNATALELIESERALLKLETEYWRAAADAWQARWKLATLSGGLWLD